MASDIEVGADRLTIPATGSVIVARTASKDNPESLQGFHAPAGRLLFLLEEASGVDDVVFEVARGALASQGAKVVMVGNPTRNSGYFYSAFHSNRALWKTMHVPWAWRPWSSETYAQEVANEWAKAATSIAFVCWVNFPPAWMTH